MQIPYRKPGKFGQTKLDPMLTQEKFVELENKLAKLKASRPKLASEVSRLAELGDFSENVEYQLAKGKLRGLNSTILKLEYQLNHVEIIDTSKNKNTISLGHKVTIDDGKKLRTYTILGSAESNPTLGFISHQSPIGLALLGHKVDDVVNIKVNEKDLKYKIIKIE